MRRFAFAMLLGALVAAVPQPAAAQYSHQAIRNGVISPTAANRLGLKRAWFTQIDLDRSQARVIGLRQHVSENRFLTVFEVVTPEGKEHFDERTVDRFGDPLGLEGAEKAAKDRVADLKKENVEAKLNTIVVPEITIYVQTDRATLHALDGATGKTKWVTTVGNRDYHSLPPGANDKYVAAINGSTVYVLDQATGKVAWSRQMESAPGAGAALSDEYLYVPTVSGKIEVFELEDHRRPPWYYQATGRLLVQPTVNTNSVSWATDRGYLYVGHRDKPGVRFRLESRDAIVAHSTFLPPNRLFAVSIDGYAYCVHEFNGDVLWKSPIGDPISEPPVATRDGLYVIGEGAGMYCLNPDNGREVKWFAPRITKLLAVTKNRVYCLGRVGQFIILDAKSGGQIDTIDATELDLVHTNWQTDRIFVGTKTGVVQCLYEMDAEFPTVHNLPDPEESQRPDVIQRTDDDKPADEPAVEPKDPFGGPADPFGGAKDPFGGADDGGGAKDPFGGSDPFGGGDADPAPADPFGGGSDPAPADPFGGGGGDDEPADDPFGGNPFGG